MPPHVSVLIGPTRAGKTFRLLEEFGQALRSTPQAAEVRAIWLAPTTRSARAATQGLLARSREALLQPGVLTFEQLVDRLLAFLPQRGKLLSPCQQRDLLRQIVRLSLDHGELTALAAVAQRSGFVDLLVDHLRELKRRDIGPADFESFPAAHDDPTKHAELAHLFRRYEELLADQGYCDLEGRYAPACEAIAAHRPWPGRLRLVVVDGFTDFTQLQLKLLASLSEHAERLLVSLPGDSDERPAAGRDDLFAKPHATLAELRARFPQLQVERLPPRPSDWPALDHLATHLFRNPRQVPTLPAAARPSLDRLSIVAAAGTQDEIVQIAREIKRRLVAQQARPGDVAVVFRSLAGVAPRVREVFTEFGIPHLVESGVPLLASGAVRTLLSLLRLVTEDWPFRRVVSVVTNNSLTALEGPARAAADWLIRDLQIAQGRDILLSRAEHLATQVAELPTGHPAKRRGDAAVAALPLLRLLAAALDELPSRASITDWNLALNRLGTQLGLRAITEPTDAARPSGGVDDQLAWQCVVQHLASLDRLAAQQGILPTTLSLADFLSTLIDVATHETLPQPFDEVGRVRVLSAATARTVAVRHLFLAGLSEQAFPSPERAGRFYAEDDYRKLARSVGGVRKSSFPEVKRSQEEMLLFYEVLTRATDRLTLSYPALDEKAQSLPPSPYLTELERTLGQELTAARRVAPRLSPLPADNAPRCPADWRIQAVASALEGESGLLAGLLADQRSAAVASSLDAALRIIYARARGHSFGPFEGLVTSSAARQKLAQRFGPQHMWSPSQLETYAGCPYQFYLNEVLGLAPLGELALETDFARRGTFLHDVLAEFHRGLLAAGAGKKASLARDRPAFVAAFQEAVDAVRQTMPQGGIEAALVEIDRRQIHEWAATYFDDLAKYDAQWSKLSTELAPAHFEVRFGPRRPGDSGPDDPRSTDRPLELDIGGERIKIAGRIDRIDVGQAGSRRLFNVIDYKSGKRPTLSRDRIESGECLQPALYVMAAQAAVFVGEDAAPVWSGYWSMKNGLSVQARSSLHCSTSGDAPTDEWQELQPIVAQRIGRFVRAIRNGDFPVTSRDEHCTSRCDFNTVCRIAQVRSLAKTWPPNPDS